MTQRRPRQERLTHAEIPKASIDTPRELSDDPRVIQTKPKESPVSDFKEFIKYRALAFKYDRQNTDLTEAVLASDQGAIPLRNVCAKLTVELAERVDNAANVMGITKRLFIERALQEAIDLVNATMDEVNAWEGFGEAE
jgi:hypothetical protein